MVALGQAETARSRPAPAPERPPGVVEAPARAPRPVRRPAPRRAARPGRALLVLLLTGVVVFGLVLLNIYLAQTSFALSDVQSQVAEQQSRQRRLRSEVATAEAPEHIARMARELGLVVPAETQTPQ